MEDLPIASPMPLLAPVTTATLEIAAIFYGIGSVIMSFTCCSIEVYD